MADNGQCFQCQDDNDSPVNWTALVISVVALLGTFAQVVQQYYASAAGYANCGESVMGGWHVTKRRKFRKSELRFEVQFETPVIFVCPPTNKNGPIKDEKIIFVTGHPDSVRASRVRLPNDEKKAEEEAAKDAAKAKQQRVHTADNERASWVMLLSHLHVMENESREWQDKQLATHVASLPPQPAEKLPKVDYSQYTLAVALQPKRRSMDNMPADVKRPYATTTMCHLIEITAMLGIYWQEFDRSKDKYRAEGNGYIVTGSHVADLGIMFTFQLSGKNHFTHSRVIPVDEIKELCCGFVSTLFRGNNSDMRRIEFPNEDPRDLSVLRLGSFDEIAETMVLIECNTDTANYFRSPNRKHGHLFPVPFELLGMLGKTLRIRNTAFRMLPNPTPYHWDKNFFNLRRMVREYRVKIRDTDSNIMPTAQVRDLRRLADRVMIALDIDKETKTPGYSISLLNTLHDALDSCDEFLRSANRELVHMVVREHFQQVLKMLNTPAPEKKRTGLDDASSIVDESIVAERFDELTAASPEHRQKYFMDIYFFIILDQVRTRAVQALHRQKTTRYAPSVHSRDPSGDSTHSPVGETNPVSPTLAPMAASVSAPVLPAPSAPAAPANPSQTLHTPARPITPTTPATPTGMLSPPFSPGFPRLTVQESARSVPTLRVRPPEASDSDSEEFFPNTMTESYDTQATSIWCTLVFRMLCWLLLHDFNKRDVQLPKSELLGSRLSVYIA